MAAGDFRDALAKRLDYRIDHGAASDLAAFFGGHDVHLPDVPGGLQRAARLDAEKFCGAIVRGVAHRASNEAVKREEELEAATARHLEWRAANKRKRKERRRRRKFDASATLSDLRAAEAMVTRGDDDMRRRKLGKAIAARLDPTTRGRCARQSLRRLRAVVASCRRAGAPDGRRRRGVQDLPAASCDGLAELMRRATPRCHPSVAQQHGIRPVDHELRTPKRRPHDAVRVDGR